MLAAWLSTPGHTALGLARELGVSHSTVLRWVEFGIPPERLAQVAAATGLTPHELRPDLAALFDGGARAQEAE